ncbi:MAG: hypothetical protein AMXMBFR45_24120 [Gammaproteobacteria bacterium]
MPFPDFFADRFRALLGGHEMIRCPVSQMTLLVQGLQSRLTMDPGEDMWWGAREALVKHWKVGKQIDGTGFA